MLLGLHNLPTGQSAYIKELTTTGAIRRRLQDLGFVEGARVKCIQRSPLGDPTAFLVCGAVIALRHEDACNVHISDVR